MQDKQVFLDRMNKINRIGTGCSELLEFMPFACCCAPCGFHSAFLGPTVASYSPRSASQGF